MYREYLVSSGGGPPVWSSAAWVGDFLECLLGSRVLLPYWFPHECYLLRRRTPTGACYRVGSFTGSFFLLNAGSLLVKRPDLLFNAVFLLSGAILATPEPSKISHHSNSFLKSHPLQLF